MRALTVFLLAGCVLLTVAFFSFEQQSPASADEGIDPISYRTDDVLFLGKPRATYLEEIEALEDHDIEEFFRQTVFSWEAAPKEDNRKSVMVFKEQIRYYILNKRSIDEAYLKFLRSIFESFEEIIQINAEEKLERNRKIRLYKQVNIQITYLPKEKFIKFAEKIKKTRPHLSRIVGDGEYCFAIIWGDESSGNISNALVALIEKNEFFEFRSCAFEEIYQIFGVVNDSNYVSGSLLNYDVSISDFHGVDLFVLKMLYNKKIKPGSEYLLLKDKLDEVISETRGWFELCFRNRACE